jgi:hypothetical protein
LYEMLTGELPEKQFEPPSRKVHVDVRLDEIVLRALDRSPELRWQTAADLRTQIVTLGSGVPPVVPHAPAVAPAFPAASAPSAPLTIKSNTYPRLAAVLVIISLLFPLLFIVSTVGFTRLDAHSEVAVAAGSSVPPWPARPAWTFFMLPIALIGVVLELAFGLTGTLLGWSHLSAQRRQGQPFQHLISGLFASLFWTCLLGGLLAALVALLVCAILGLPGAARLLSLVACGTAVWWIVRTTLRWLHAGAPAGPSSPGKSNGKGVSMAVIGCVGLGVLGAVVVFVLLAGFWFSARRDGLVPIALPPAQTTSHATSPSLFPNPGMAPSPDVEVLIRADNLTPVDPINKAMQALQAAQVVHVRIQRVEDGGLIARVVAPRGCPQKRVEEVAHRLREAGVPRIETEIVEPVSATTSAQAVVPQEAKIINTEGAHVLTQQLTLVIHPPDTAAHGESGERGYSIIWKNGDGTQTERGHAPLARPVEDYVAYWSPETNRLWLGSPSYLAWHQLVRGSDESQAWVSPADIPKDIAGVMPPEFAAAVSKWYPRMPQH